MYKFKNFICITNIIENLKEEEKESDIYIISSIKWLLKNYNREISRWKQYLFEKLISVDIMVTDLHPYSGIDWLFFLSVVTYYYYYNTYLIFQRIF